MDIMNFFPLNCLKSREIQNEEQTTFMMDPEVIRWNKFNASAFHYPLNINSFVNAGIDHDQSIVAIGRVHHEGEIIPGKVLLRHGVFHFCFGNEEISAREFEILEYSSNFYWEESSNGKVPANAVIGGETSGGEKLYIGRAKHRDLVIPGKICPSERCIYVPCDWKVHRKNNYEILLKIPVIDFSVLENEISLSHKINNLRILNCPSTNDALEKIEEITEIFFKKRSSATRIEFQIICEDQTETCEQFYNSFAEKMENYSKFLASFEFKNEFLIFWKLKKSSDVFWLKFSKNLTENNESLQFVVEFILKELNKNSNAIHRSLKKLRKGRRVCLEILTNSKGFNLLFQACEENKSEVIEYLSITFNINKAVNKQIASDFLPKFTLYDLWNVFQNAYRSKVRKLNGNSLNSTLTNDEIYLLDLLALSNVKMKDRHNLRSIFDAFTWLTRNDELKNLLKFIAKRRRIQIYFDFEIAHDENSIDNDSYMNKLYFAIGKIYIAAKHLRDDPNADGEKYFEALGEIAKKFCQFSVFKFYKNDGNPFEAEDSAKQIQFSTVLQECERLKDKEEILKSVYQRDEDDKKSELIASYPQMVARYINRPKRLGELESLNPDNIQGLKRFYQSECLPKIVQSQISQNDEEDDDDKEYSSFLSRYKFYIINIIWVLTLICVIALIVCSFFPCWFGPCGNYEGVECFNQGFRKFECQCPRDFKFESNDCHECLQENHCRKNFTCHLRSCVNEFEVHYCNEDGNEKILKSQLCDGKENCRDKSDEKVCVQGEVRNIPALSIKKYLPTFEPFDNFTVTLEDLTINSDVNEKVQIFYIKDNKKIEFLPVAIAKKFPNLIEFRATFGVIKKINANTFRGLSSLEIVHLYFNEIEAIEKHAFDDLTKVQDLNFEVNKIVYLPPEIFFTLNKLKIINLNYNTIANFDANLLEYNRRLETIKLQGIEIEKVNENLIECLNDIKCIDLTDNKCINKSYGECETDLTPPINLTIKNQLKKDLHDNCAN